jgi:Ca2+-binding RTX toxin-like protein/subtilisin-like proprotein convertase family protein
MSGESPVASEQAPATGPEAEAGGAAAPAPVTRPPPSQATIPTDPLFAQQWHLRNTTPGLLDLNVIDVWDDYTGQGIEIAVIDNAFDRTHVDLDGNYDIGKDWDFENNVTDPSPAPGDALNHGTAVAGIIAAEEGNGTGVVGVAYGSTIFGFRTANLIGNAFVQQTTDAINNASGVSQAGGADRQADIVNMSLGTTFASNYFDLFLSATDMAALNTAIDNAAILGRGGLGTIIVKSAGNQRGIDGDTNAESWSASRHTIAVAAVDQDGFVSSYSNPGASVFVSAFGTPGQVVTTDRTGADGYNPGPANPDYAFGFNGTSAAAPMVSGVVALMLEANGGLGWRDVQQILAYSARQVGTDVGSGTGGFERYAWAFNGAFNWNGGGLHFSNDYGFGLVDALAAVRLAETWFLNGFSAATSANESSAFDDALDVATTIATPGPTSFTVTPDTSVRIERVVVDVSFTQWHDLDDLRIELVDPNGRVSVLIDRASTENDGTSAGGFGAGRWEFTTNFFRGQFSTGNWTLNFYDVDSSSISPITINDIDVTFTGSFPSVNDTYYFSNEFSDYAGLFSHGTSFNDFIGQDTINAAAVTSGSTIDLANGTGTIDGAAITLSNIERVITGDGNDTIREGGSAGIQNQFWSFRGNDTIIKTAATGSASDTFQGGTGSDWIELEGSNFGATHAIILGAGIYNNGVFTDTIVGFENARADGNAAALFGDSGNNILEAIGNFANSLSGGSGIDTLHGGDGDDTLNGGLFDDTCYGGNGNDTFRISGADLIDHVYGGAGTDTLDTSGNTNAAVGFVVNLAAGTWDTTTPFGPYTVQGVERVIGTDRNDTLTGGSDTETLDGGLGNDLLNGGLNTDSIVGGGGNDTIVVSAGHFFDNVDAGAGADTLDHSAHTSSGSTFDFLAGVLTSASTNFGTATLAGIETYLDGFGANTIISTGDGSYFGGGGNDLMKAGLTSIGETMDGGAGTDTLDVTSWSGGYIVDMSTGATNFGESFTNFENFVGGNGNTEVAGTNGANTIFTGLGNDTLIGGLGADVLGGGFGDDTFIGGSDTDTIFAGNGNDVIVFAGGFFFDSVDGGAGTDTLDATAHGIGGTYDFEAGTISGFSGGNVTGIEIFRGSDAAADTVISDGNGNTYFGQGGNDLMIAEFGTETMDGGAGLDWIDLSRFAVDIQFDLATGLTQFAGELYTNFESAIMGAGNDSVGGTITDDTIVTSAGNDTVSSGDGSDTIQAGDGNDNVFGGAGADSILTGAGNDIVQGGLGIDQIGLGGGDDTLIVGVGHGPDTATGGNQIDTLDWSENNGVTDFDMATGAFSFDLAAGSYLEFEHYSDGDGRSTVIGTDKANVITGNGGNDVIRGQIGADQITGGLGKDKLFGGQGGDVIDGGEGRNTIEGGLGNDSLTGGSTVDRIVDGVGVDLIRGAAGNDVFAIFVDTNNDTVEDFTDGADRVELAGLTFVDLTITDLGGGRIRVSYAGDKLFLEDDGAGLLTGAQITAADFIFV